MYDLIIVGGGISGIGIAREASQFGLSALLLEKDKCASATSANSMRIIHGGFRYLQNFDIPRVIQSLQDQSDLLNQYPGLIEPLQCVMPLNRWGLRSALPLRSAGMFYGLLKQTLTGKKSNHKIISKQILDKKVPILQGLSQHGAFQWTDAIMPDPGAFVQAIQEEILESGIEIQEHTRCDSLDLQNGALKVYTEKGIFEGHAVVNATGPWLETLNITKELKPERPPIYAVKGFNLVLNCLLDPSCAIGIYSEEGRLFFCVPRAEHTVIGTFYKNYAGNISDASVSDQEIHEVLESFKRALPQFSAEEVSVIDVDCGILPGKSSQNNAPELYGSEQIFSRNGYFEVMSTKYTTFQSQARKVVQQVRKFLETKK